MKNLIFTTVLIFLVTAVVASQQTNSSNSSAAPQTSRQAPIVQRQIDPARIRQEAINEAEDSRTTTRDIDHKYLGIRREINALYRKTNKKETSLINPNPANAE
jgi:hypothetical protein